MSTKITINPANSMIAKKRSYPLQYSYTPIEINENIDFNAPDKVNDGNTVIAQKVQSVTRYSGGNRNTMADTVLNGFMDDLAQEFSIKIEGKNFSDRLVNLADIIPKKGNNFTGYLKVYKDSLITEANKEQNVLKTFFARCIESYIVLFTSGCNTKKQHWLPYFVLRNFSNKSNNKITSRYAFDVNAIVEGKPDTISAIQFIHQSHYSDFIETLFSRIENSVSVFLDSKSGKGKKGMKYNDVVIYSFMQMFVRNQRTNGKFINGDTMSIINAFCDSYSGIMNNMPNVMIVNVKVSPFVINRNPIIRKYWNSGKSVVLNVDSNNVVVLTEKFVDRSNAIKIANENSLKRIGDKKAVSLISKDAFA